MRATLFQTAVAAPPPPSAGVFAMMITSSRMHTALV